MKQGLMVCVFTLVFLGCNNKREVRIYLVPKAYEGPLLIIEDATSKDTIQKSGDTLIFDYTKSLILKLRGSFIENSISLSNMKYYYVDTKGNRTEIPYAMEAGSKTDSNKVYVYLRHTQIGENSQCDLITTPKNFGYYFQQQEKLCDSLLSRRP